MNAAELNTELTKLVNRAWGEGLAKGKMSPCEIIGLLHMHADGVDLAVRQAQNQAAKEIIQVPGFRLPPGRG